MATNKPNKKSWFAAAILFILIAGGIVVAYAADSYASDGSDENMNGKPRGGFMQGMGPMMHGRGLLGNASKTEIKKEFLGNAIDELGLSENATLKEIQEAMKTKRIERETEMNETREAIADALEDEDYEAWKTAVNNTPQGNRLLEKITEDNFPKYAEMQEYLSKAEELAKELNITAPGNGMHNGGGKREGAMEGMGGGGRRQAN